MKILLVSCIDSNRLIGCYQPVIQTQSVQSEMHHRHRISSLDSNTKYFEEYYTVFKFYILTQTSTILFLVARKGTNAKQIYRFNSNQPHDIHTHIELNDSFSPSLISIPIRNQKLNVKTDICCETKSSISTNK